MRNLSLLFLSWVVCICGASAASKEIKVSTLNGYINEGNKALSISGSSANEIQLRKGGGATRWGYLSFPLDEVDANAKNISLNVFLTHPLANQPDLDPLKANLLMYGITGYDIDNTITWNSKTEPTNDNESYIGKVALSNDLKGKYLKFDVTEFVKKQKAEGKTTANFRMQLDGAATAITVVYIRAHKEGSSLKFPPMLIQDEESKESSITAKGLNGFVQQASGDAKVSLDASQYIYLRKSNGFARAGFVTFPMDYIVGENAINSEVILKIWVPESKNTAADFANSTVSLLGINNYEMTDASTWNTYAGIAEKDEVAFDQTYTLSDADKNTYLTWDVTAFVKAKKQAGAKQVQFRLTLDGSASNTGTLYLMGEQSANTTIYNTTPPALDQTIKAPVSILPTEKDNELFIFPTATSDILNVNTTGQIDLYSIAGQLIQQTKADNGQINVSTLANGIYLIKADNKTAKFIKK